MSQSCNNNCSSCGEECASRTAPQSFAEPQNEFSDVKNLIAVVSGKGGVGKSLVTSLLACGMNRRGHSAAVLDADITGPSIPRIFGVDALRADAAEEGILPVKSAEGIELMSVNLLLEDATEPVVWRGPVISGVVKQFWHDVVWGNVDYMFVDMPPGTGDVPLTVFQSLPVKGIVIVASPQELVGMIVQKAVKMAELMNVPVIGLVENMAYFECPDCGKRHELFGPSHIWDIAAAHEIGNVSQLPLDPSIAAACDSGLVETVRGDWLDNILDAVEML